ncbi:hypothetical protein EIN_528660 [Entamoeba invadens IP1]|uniref:Uncharacterized protein n=1 Tax=Entamoeba invadens IP1 TaxID=370355 RepID=A0A0A1U2E6_ENTIV|nr:hypothetical protein EIN_528660 [Entamoeba invadens IP1]ELP86787.1 hypothetical protein EIN_528660 [Entamoeba invadens IP1]|eukprot:XP_004253558.1 hypothetical protein EIN_528660 [Entamoeba invadens IP1]
MVDLTGEITVKLDGLNPGITYEDLQEKLSSFELISSDIPTYEADTEMGNWYVELPTSNDAFHLASSRNCTQMAGTTIHAKVDKNDYTQCTVYLIDIPSAMKAKDLREELKEYDIKRIRQVISKKGKLKGHAAKLVVKDLETAKNIRLAFNGKKIGRLIFRVILYDKNGKIINVCCVCGDVGHLLEKCPVKLEEFKRLREEKRAQKVEENRKRQMEKNERNKQLFEEKKNQGVVRKQNITDEERKEKHKKMQRRKEQEGQESSE